ncbi:MAG: PUA domain-containing protein, partial [Thermococcus sp.]
HVKGSKMLRLFVGDQQTGTFRDGVISVTPFGMQRIYDSLKAYWVKIDFDLRGDVFAVGVNEADEKIRPDDIVGVVRDEKVVGVGKAVLSGEEMIKAKKGVAVKVRKRA